MKSRPCVFEIQQYSESSNRLGELAMNVKILESLTMSCIESLYVFWYSREFVAGATRRLGS